MLRLWNATSLYVRLALIAGAAVFIPIAWYLGSPLFINQEVMESFPFGVVAPRNGGSPARVEAGGASSSEPVALTRGSFGEIDAIHKGEGAAVIYRLTDGSRVLRFEDFRVTNGPDLYVYLSGHAAPRDSAQLHEGAALEVARLKGNVGSQNYELPTDLDLSKMKSVVIYCKRFTTVFSSAGLSDMLD